MKRAFTLRRSLLAVAALSSAVIGLWIAGRPPGEKDPSIVLADHGAVSPKVENGSAFDRATIDTGAAKKLVLPDNAVVQRTAEAGPLRLFLKKTLAFGGHPNHTITIRDVRKEMGCATKTEDAALLIATFGEFDSRIEGGTFIRLLAVVPQGIEVQQRPGLSGTDSPGWRSNRSDLLKDGWTAIPDVPDPDRSAQGLSVR